MLIQDYPLQPRPSGAPGYAAYRTNKVMAINCGGSRLRLDYDRLVNNRGPRLKEVADNIK